MVRLDSEVDVKGCGIKNLTAKLIKRDGQVAMYLRDDGQYEVGVIKVRKEGLVFGDLVPEREVYFSNEDFGSTALSTPNLEQAEKHFQTFLTREANGKKG